jgi:hypothetical protein
MASGSSLLPCAFFSALFTTSFTEMAAAEKLHVISNPPGATVSIDGVTEGITPFDKDFPRGYFHRTHTAFGSRLEHATVARISLAGYATKELTMTDGPMNWIGLNGHNYGEYFLFKTDHFHVNLEPIAGVITGTVSERSPQRLSSASLASVTPDAGAPGGWRFP